MPAPTTTTRFVIGTSPCRAIPTVSSEDARATGEHRIGGIRCAPVQTLAPSGSGRPQLRRRRILGRTQDAPFGDDQVDALIVGVFRQRVHYLHGKGPPDPHGPPGKPRQEPVVIPAPL